MCNADYIQKLMDEEGMSYGEAVYEAAATMDGACEDENGIRSTQTACHRLRYPETLPPRRR